MTVSSAGPDESTTALGPYLRAIRSRAALVALITLAAVGVAAALLALRSPTYESTAQLLVSPLPQDDTTFLGTGLLRDSGDPTRTVQTAAAVVASPAAAQRTAARVGGGLTRSEVESRVDVQPLGESNILSVTASADSAVAATRLANQYALSALTVRNAQIRRQVDAAIRTIGPRPTSDENKSRLPQLRTVRARGDPTLTLSQPAREPAHAGGAPAWLVLLLAAVAGFTLGSIAAVVTERLDGRVRDEDDLLALAPFPILARIPVIGRKARATPDAPGTWAARESFRTLQIQLDQRRSQDGGGQVVMVTSASSGDGKTSTALELALALVRAGHKVILIDCDLRKPDVAARLALKSADGLVALLTSRFRLRTLLQPAATPALKVLTATGASRENMNMLLHRLDRRIGKILEEATKLAAYVVVDTPPLGEVGDALTIAAHVDELVLVGRPQHTNRHALRTSVELLDRAETSPTGWVIIGEEGAKLSQLYSYAKGNGAGRSAARSRSEVS